MSFHYFKGSELFVYLITYLLLYRHILYFFHFFFFGHHFQLLLRNNLLFKLFNFLDCKIIRNNNFSRYFINNSLFFILYNFFLNRNPLYIMSLLVINYFFLIWHVFHCAYTWIIYVLLFRYVDGFNERVEYC